MTDDEKRELQNLLSDDLKTNGKSEADIIRETDSFLDEDSGQFFISSPELIVFQLQPQYAPALLHAYCVFEDAHNMTSPNHFGGRLLELIRILPAFFPIPKFKERVFSQNHFIWLAYELYQIPEQQAYGYFFKREMNMMNLITFAV